MNIVTEMHCVFRGLEHWSAIDDDSYDGPESPCGFGHSEQEAIDSLCDALGLPYSMKGEEQLLQEWAAQASQDELLQEEQSYGHE